MERWYRQDYDRWPDTHGHAPVTDRNFWFTLDGTEPRGKGVPFEHAEWELAQHVWNSTVGGMTRQNVGGFLMVSGAAILAPGPVDLAVAGAGAAVGGPYGAVAGVVAYNALGFAMLLGGMHLLGVLPSLPDPNWSKLRKQMPPMGATPVVWGVPGYLG